MDVWAALAAVEVLRSSARLTRPGISTWVGYPGERVRRWVREHVQSLGSVVGYRGGRGARR